MPEKDPIEVLLNSMTKAELRDLVRGIFARDEKLRDSFVASHSKPKDDPENPETLEKIKVRAQKIADKIEKNVRDEGELWRIARLRLHSSRYLDDAEAFAAAIEKEVAEAKRFGGSLAKKGCTKLALEFARIAEERIEAALGHSEYPLDWSGFDLTDLWEGILKGAGKDRRREAFDAILEEVEAEKDPDWHLSFLCHHPEPACADRLLRLVDKRIAVDRCNPEFRNDFDLPTNVYRRKLVMRAAGQTEAEINAYLAKAFRNCAFGLTRRLAGAESLKDAKEAAVVCKALLTLRLDPEKRREYTAKLARYQAEAGIQVLDAAGVKAGTVAEKP